MTSFAPHPYQCRLIYPHTASITPTSDDSLAAVLMKAPERGDSRIKGRNQNFARTKNGNVVVYDMGTTMADMLTLSFEYMPQAEFAAMLVFFEYVTWGANKIKYVDYKGDEYIVRVYKNSVTAINNGEAKLGDSSTTLYNFTLDLIDVTNNIADSGQTAVPTQLAIHLADTVHPHNPKSYSNVLAADGAKVVETHLVDSVKAITWIINLRSGATYSQTMLVHATHNGTSYSDATTIANTQEVLVTDGAFPGDVTINVVLSGVASAQVLALTVAKAAGEVEVSARRIIL